AGSLQRLLQREVSEILEEEDAQRAVEVADGGHGQPPSGHEGPDDHEGKLVGVEGLGVEREHRDLPAGGDAVVTARGGVARQRGHLDVSEAGTEAVGEELRDPHVGRRIGREAGDGQHLRRRRRERRKLLGGAPAAPPAGGADDGAALAVFLHALRPGGDKAIRLSHCPLGGSATARPTASPSATRAPVATIEALTRAPRPTRAPSQSTLPETTAPSPTTAPAPTTDRVTRARGWIR